MNAPAVVPASYVRLSTLTDGTLRIVLDIEPRHIADAFSLFDKPGVPVAVARITNDAAVRADHETSAVRPQRTALQGEDAASLAASSPAPKRERTLAEKVFLRLRETEFRKFIADRDRATWMNYMAAGYDSHAAANAIVKSFCGVGSKADIVLGAPTGDAWLTLEETYLAHARGVAA